MQNPGIDPEILPTATKPTTSPNATTATTKMILAHQTEFHDNETPTLNIEREYDTTDDDASAVTVKTKNV